MCVCVCETLLISPPALQVTVVGTVIMGDILAQDLDQQGPFSTVQYSILEGPYSVNPQALNLFHLSLLLPLPPPPPTFHQGVFEP